MKVSSALVLKSMCWYFILFGAAFITNSKCVERAQRRFMWKQMDETMDGIIDTMASSARAMRSMFGDFIPVMTTPPTIIMQSNILDFVPSETTKTKYIFHHPSTKAMKIIKMSPPKKVIKIMSLPKETMEYKTLNNKPKIQLPSPEALRQMEREQELIAEGRLAPKSNGDIIRGKIPEFGKEWKPVSTEKPYHMSELHTSIHAESLPEAEKQSYDPPINEVDEYDDAKRKNSYEVTEHTPEETVAVPYTQVYHNSRGFVPIRFPGTQSNLRSNTQMPTEAPNYPATFLKKQRERLSSNLKHLKTTAESFWVPMNETSFFNSKPKTASPNIKFQTKTESWPFLGPTILPTPVELSTAAKVRKAEPLPKTTTTEPPRPQPTKRPINLKPRDIRQRGSVKFGDKLSELYK